MKKDEFLLKSVFDTAYSFGLDSMIISLYDTFSDFTEFPVDERIARYNQAGSSDYTGSVLLPLIQGHAGINTYRYAILAHAFRVRGYKPILLQCDSGLPLCHRKKQSWSNESICSICEFYGEELLDAFGLDVIRLSELVDLEDESYVSPKSEYRGIQTSRFAKASSRKFLKKYHIENGDREDERVYRDFLSAANILVDATNELMDRYDIHAALAHDDKYVYGGIPLAVADEHGVPAYSLGLGYREKTMMLGKTTNKSSLPWFTDREVLSDRLSTPLEQEQVDTIRKFMSERSTGGGDSRHHYSAVSDESVESADDLSVGMFTNLIWDASLEHDTAAYPDVFEWIRDTIEYLGKTDGIHLVVKTHPAEAVRGTNESIDEWIHTNLDVQENVTVLEPDTSVNTYELFQDLDAGIVYNSTVGLEMSFRGIPVVVGGKTHYRNLGFTFDPDTPEEYRTLLDGLGDLEVTNEMQRRVERYAYFLFYQKHLPFPFYGSGSDHEVTFLPVTADDLKPGVEVFDRLVSRCVAGEPIYMENPTQ